MRIPSEWKDYELIDTSNGERLERWGKIKLIRPDPQIIWQTLKMNKGWQEYDAKYIRSKTGGGFWKIRNKFEEKWTIRYKDLKFLIKPTGFKHTGLFPEQAINWDFIENEIKQAKRKINVINLFAYTGGATLASAKAGANVCHIDSSKGAVAWARENAVLSKLDDKPIRWIVDDCYKFINREYKRNKRYDVIIMDPPSYGRGPNGEIWVLEENIYKLLKASIKILNDNPLFMMINTYSNGLSSGVIRYMIESVIYDHFGDKIKDKIKITSDEIGLKVNSTSLYLPCGNTVIINFKL